MDTVADITTRDDARWKFIEMQAGPLVLSRWLSAGLVLAVVVILALTGALMYLGNQMAHLKPVVIRIDGVGRAEAVTYDAATWRPQIPELRYFLAQFTQLHFNRIKATVPKDYPDSLYFLDDGLRTAVLNGSGGKNPVETFAENPAADEVLIEVKNVTFSNLDTPPYRAAVDYVRRSFAPQSRQPLRTDTLTAQMAFTYREFVPNPYMRVNPLGLQITQLRVDAAFDSTKGP